VVEAYQRLGGSVECVSVVSAELGVGAVQGRVSRSLRLLDAAQ